MQINILSPDDHRWQLAVSELFHDFYHLPAYSQLESERLKAIPQCAVIRDGSKVFLMPYLLRSCDDLEGRWSKDVYDVVSPYGYPGFVVNEEGQDNVFIENCFNELKLIWYEQNICSAFIRLHPIINNYFPSSNSFQHNLLFTHGNIVVCDLLATNQDIWKQTRRNHRNTVGKLEDFGFSCSITSVNELNSLKDFIQIYEETMIRVGAKDLYFFGQEYFGKLASVLDKHLHVCEVKMGDRVVASSLVTESCGIVQYYLGGTKSDFVNQSPSTMMVNTIRFWAKERGNSYLNLGGGVGSNEDSLYHFKAGFSKLTKPFVSIKMVVNENVYQNLTKLSYQGVNRPVSDTSRESFFPAYRA
jgi:Acetyltransferase (GNAT) domain